MWPRNPRQNGSLSRPATSSRNQSTRASAAGRLRATLALRLGEQRRRVAAVAAVLLGAAIGEPAGDHRLGGLGVELRRHRTGRRGSAGARPPCAASTSKPSRRGENVVVPLHPRPGGDAALADRRSRTTRSPAPAERLTVPPRAWDSTWAPKQIASSGMSWATTSRTSAASASTSSAVSGRYTFHSDPSVSTSSTPSSAGQSAGSLPVALGEREAALAETVADEARHRGRRRSRSPAHACRNGTRRRRRGESW